MRRFGIIIGIGLLGLLILYGAIYLSKRGKKVVVHTIDRTEEVLEQKKAEKLLKESKPLDALKIIHEYEDDINSYSDIGRKWLDLLIDASTQIGNFTQLIILYEAFPKAFEENETASLLVADAYILTKRPKDYLEIRQKWKGREKNSESWFVLDSDELLLEGKRREALELLNSKKYAGKEDVPRLIRIALLYALDNPKEAWDYLTQAYTLDPTNSDIRIYRARLLENVGQDALALSEYIGAAQVSPKNLFLRDELAEYYMRHGKVPEGMAIWIDALKQKPTLDLIWIKLLFWRKVAMPVKIDWDASTPPSGRYNDLVEYLKNLGPNVFWDQKAFEKIPNYEQYLTSQQFTFWLRLIQALKDGRETDAANLLQYNTFTRESWKPQLENALKRILKYRTSGTLIFESTINPLGKANQVQNEAIVNQNFFDQIEYYAIRKPNEKLPQDLHDLIASKEAFSAALLAGGWFEAALELNTMQVIPDTFPSWVAYGFTEAIRIDRGVKEAIEFAKKQKPTPNLNVLIGELYIADKNLDEALKVLSPYVAESSDIGARAAWMSALVYNDKGQYDKAKELVQSQPALANQIIGKELLARIAVLEGNVDLADKLYSEIQNQSAEAKSYLAQRAFAEKDWGKAKDLTEQLILQFPDNPLLRENLQKIEEEQKGLKPKS